MSESKKVQNILLFMVAALVVVASAWGVVRALRSDLFLLKSIEVRFLQPPVLKDGTVFEPSSLKSIQNLAGIEPGSQNLTLIDLNSVEQRLRTNPWLRTIQMRKVFPNTLLIEVDFRIPVAIVQEKDEPLLYLDADLETRVPVQPEIVGNLPLVHIEDQMGEKPAIYREISQIIDHWQETNLNQLGELAGFKWSSLKGVQALVLYKLPNHSEPARAWLEIGQYYGSQLFDDLIRLSRVLNYLTINSIEVSQIFLAGNKKIVVKTARRS